MILYIPNENHQNLLVFDIEFTQDELVQFSGLLFENIGDNVYQLSRSINQYIKTKVDYRFVSYTGITSSFLEENGIRLCDMQELLKDFLTGISEENLLLVSHGLKSDLMILESNGINWKNFDRYCTYRNAQKLLNRNNKLKVKDIAEECGYYLDGEHNAYHDVWAHVSIFCFLKKLEFLAEEE